MDITSGVIDEWWLLFNFFFPVNSNNWMILMDAAGCLSQTHYGLGWHLTAGWCPRQDTCRRWRVELQRPGTKAGRCRFRSGAEQDPRAYIFFTLQTFSLVTFLSVEDLVHEIEHYQGLRALRLEGNTVGVEAARAIAKALESKDLLQVFLCQF